MDHLARRRFTIQVVTRCFGYNLVGTQFYPLWYIKRQQWPFLGFNWFSRLIPHHMLQVKMFHFPTTTVQQCQGLFFTTFWLFQKITHVHGWQRKIISLCILTKWKSQRNINTLQVIVVILLAGKSSRVLDKGNQCKSSNWILPLCFCINQALLLLPCIPNSAHIHVILLYILKNRLMNEDSCKKRLQRNNL